MPLLGANHMLEHGECNVGWKETDRFTGRRSSSGARKKRLREEWSQGNVGRTFAKGKFTSYIEKFHQSPRSLQYANRGKLIRPVCFIV